MSVLLTVLAFYGDLLLFLRELFFKTFLHYVYYVHNVYNK